MLCTQDHVFKMHESWMVCAVATVLSLFVVHSSL
jgi:hypothetical protein